jgi:hypothetical protein
MGFEVSSSWLDTATDYGKTEATPERLKWAGGIDLVEITACDIFIIDTIDESNTGGRESELGYLICLQDQKKDSPNYVLWRVGPLRQLYHAFADKTFDTWEQCLEALKGLQ